MYRVRLEDASTDFIPVSNFPAGNSFPALFDITSAVYVKKLNRIYIFGGQTNNGSYIEHDSIWYIDLPSPPEFDCSKLTYGYYPHPTDCSSFFICLDVELAGEYSCPPPLLFCPIQQTCTKADPSKCFLSCDGREGLQPHPTNCSKFLFCTKGGSTIEVFYCPEPLLFDPVLLRCSLPQLVNYPSF
jgi:hypothetical protein